MEIIHFASEGRERQVQFFDPQRGRGAAIPYEQFADLLFTDDSGGTQKLVPFLGAGASLGQHRRADDDMLNPAPADKVRDFIEALHLSGTAARFIELATQLAIRIQATEQAGNEGASNLSPFTVACAAKYPQSAGELAAALAVRTKYNGFECPVQRLQPLLPMGENELTHLVRSVADLTEIGPSVPPLLSVASYYQYTTPGKLSEDLEQIFQNKRKWTRTHWLVARAALRHLENDDKHYLVITTNYDSLIEKALERMTLSYCVLTVVSPDKPVDVRFSSNMQPYLGLKDARYQTLVRIKNYPNAFALELRKPIVIVFKLHGCLSGDGGSNKGIVISDEDYIRYLMQMREGEVMIPAMVSRYLDFPGFLSLGYSFSDWNIRAVYKSVVTRRFEMSKVDQDTPKYPVKDWAVVHEFSDYESKSSQESINLIVADLSKFARKTIVAALADRLITKRAPRSRIKPGRK